MRLPRQRTWLSMKTHCGGCWHQPQTLPQVGKMNEFDGGKGGGASRKTNTSVLGIPRYLFCTGGVWVQYTLNTPAPRPCARRQHRKAAVRIRRGGEGGGCHGGANRWIFPSSGLNNLGRGSLHGFGRRWQCIFFGLMKPAATTVRLKARWGKRIDGRTVTALLRGGRTSLFLPLSDVCCSPLVTSVWECVRVSSEGALDCPLRLRVPGFP